MTQVQVGGYLFPILVVAHLTMAGVMDDEASDTTKTAAVKETEQIPHQVLLDLTYESAWVPIKSDIPAEQLEQMKKTRQERQAHTQSLRSLWQQSNSMVSRPRRLDAARDRAIAREDEVLAKELEAMLTPKQKSAILRLNRAAVRIARQTESRKKIEGETITNFNRSSVSGSLGSDLLSVLEVPEIQDKLELTDEQFNELEALLETAAQDADRCVTECLALQQRSHEKAPVANPRHEKLLADTMQLLTEEQATLFKRLTTEPQALADAMAEKTRNDGESIFRLMRPHGSPVKFSHTLTNGSATVQSVLHNQLGQPEFRDALRLDDAQLKNIETLLDVARPEMEAFWRESIEQGYQDQQTHRRGHEEIIAAHNASFHEQAKALLTDSQTAVLAKERLRELQVRALLEESVVATLELTDEQQQSIQTLLAPKPAAVVQAGGFGFEFQSESSDEFMTRTRVEGEQRMKEYQQLLHQVEAVLTDEQKTRLQNETGFQFPK